MKNTYTSGSVRTLIFQEKNVWYGVALEFNIVESAGNLATVGRYLSDAIRAYVKVARLESIGFDVLNQKPNKEYEHMWETAHTGKPPIKSPIKIYRAESLSLSSL